MCVQLGCSNLLMRVFVNVIVISNIRSIQSQ
jgi:hypothetical protein